MLLWQFSSVVSSCLGRLKAENTQKTLNNFFSNSLGNKNKNAPKGRNVGKILLLHSSPLRNGRTRPEIKKKKLTKLKIPKTVNLRIFVYRSKIALEYRHLLKEQEIKLGDETSVTVNYIIPKCYIENI